METKDYDKYEKDIINIDEVEGTDIKINPDYYIHNALLKAQQALANDDTKTGFLKYVLFIEQIEVLCRAANMLPQTYEKDVNEIKLKDDSITEKVKLANKKLELVMASVFSTKTITEPLSDKKTLN